MGNTLKSRVSEPVHVSKLGTAASSLPPVEGSTLAVAEKPEAAVEVGGTPDDGMLIEDEAFIGKLTAIWLPHESQGLVLRHQLGLLLIAKLKELENDLDRGQTVRKAAAQRLGMSPSDLSRMCAFATRFPDFNQFSGQHPDTTTWSQVKALLPQLSQTEKNGGNAPARSKKSTEKQRQAAVTELKSIKDFIAIAKEEFNIKQAADVELITEEILDEIAAVVAPLKKKSSAQGE